MEIPFFDRETSMPRKYFKLPKTLIWKRLCRNCLRVNMALTSLPVMRMSSTYTNNDVKYLPIRRVNTSNLIWIEQI